MNFWTLVLTFLIFGCSTLTERAPASAEKSCIELTKAFFSEKSLVENQYSSRLAAFKKYIINIEPTKYENHLKDESLKQYFKKVVQSISTHDELIETLEMLRELAGITRRYSAPDPYSLKMKEMKDIYAQTISPLISTSDLITKTLELKPKLSTADQIEIMKSLRQIENQIISALGGENGIFKAASIEVNILHFQMIFDPNSTRQYVSYIINEVSKTTPNSSPTILAESYSRYLNDGYDLFLPTFGPETIKIISQIPSSIKKSLLEDLKLKFVDVPANEKGKRRNIELLMRVFANEEFSKFFKKFEKKEKMDEDLIIFNVDKLWKSSIGKFKGRDSYSFQKVLESAKTLKNSPLANWLKEDESFLIYGSFPNGKANFSSSDLDLHVSSSLLKRHHDSFERWSIEADDPELKEYINELKINQIIERGNNNLDALEQTENLLAAQWDRTGYQRGSFLSIVPSDTDFFAPQNLGIYNSIMVEVKRDKIIVYLVDMIQDKKVLSILVE